MPTTVAFVADARFVIVRVAFGRQRDCSGFGLETRQAFICGGIAQGAFGWRELVVWNAFPVARHRDYSLGGVSGNAPGGWPLRIAHAWRMGGTQRLGWPLYHALTPRAPAVAVFVQSRQVYAVPASPRAEYVCLGACALRLYVCVV